MDSHLNTLPTSWPLVPIGSICQVGAGNGAPQGDVGVAGAAGIKAAEDGRRPRETGTGAPVRPTEPVDIRRRPCEMSGADGPVCS